MMIDAITPTAPLVGIYIDIDATIVVQAIIFWAVLGFLHFALFRPYLDAVEQREQGIGGSKEDAREMEARAEDLEQEYEEKMRQARRDAQEVRETLRNQGEQKEKELVDEVREELDAKLSEERDEIDTKVASAREDLEDRAEDLADRMVDKILAGT
jgi:F-type H+-transporting ATPase subunit b